MAGRRLLIALLAVGGHHTLQSRAAAVRRTVAEKTQALAEANEALGRYVAASAETTSTSPGKSRSTPGAEARLRETTSLQRAILDCAEYAVIYTDATGIIRVMNPAAERLFGYPADTLVGKATPRILHTGEQAARWTPSGTTIGVLAAPRHREPDRRGHHAPPRRQPVPGQPVPLHRARKPGSDPRQATWASSPTSPSASTPRTGSASSPTTTTSPRC